jgi:type IV pilus assembly protein PilA
MLSQNKHSQGGFTLVELMVVVAIIGILSSVAIPSFKKYQAKAKTSEAKLHLASIYSAEVSFFSDSDSYATCLKSMGYDPSGSKDQRYYTTGFEAAISNTSDDNGYINGIQCDTDTTEDEAMFVAGKKVAGHEADASDIAGSSADADGGWFVAAAGGRISADGGDAPATSSFFKASIEAYAEAAEENTGDITEVDAGDGTISVWAVNERKEIIQRAPGY